MFITTDFICNQGLLNECNDEYKKLVKTVCVMNVN